ncbi:MAG: hypothetical protein D6815_02560 [Candidatus Dadabacteria bacterium]|nr:MAG: hypothetical protein D6815_02560 [Candidatus Dadabacteria bacterium]
MKRDSQAPNLTHANAVAICEMALRAMGLRAKRAVDHRDGYDFLVEDRVRVAVRYAKPSSEREQTYRRRSGEISRYVYKRWTFNFHRHGRMSERYCDFFVCFLAAPGSGTEAPGDVSVFVIPWEAITGLTFCSSMREGSPRPYRGKYAIYRDAWNLIYRAARGEDAPHERKILRIGSDARRRLMLFTGAEVSKKRQPRRTSARRREASARMELSSE